VTPNTAKGISSEYGEIPVAKAAAALAEPDKNLRLSTSVIWKAVLKIYGAGGGSRTHMPFGRSILSRLRLPFRHTGLVLL
jgi:hypothetical protein